MSLVWTMNSSHPGETKFGRAPILYLQGLSGRLCFLLCRYIHVCNMFYGSIDYSMDYGREIPGGSLKFMNILISI